MPPSRPRAAARYRRTAQPCSRRRGLPPEPGRPNAGVPNEAPSRHPAATASTRWRRTYPRRSTPLRGAVYIDPVATASEPARVAAASVHFTPSARTAWHTHPFGQTLYVTEGIGLCQRRGGPVEVIRPGDRVFFEAGEDHWHGAAPNRFMTHLAVQEVDDQGSEGTRGDAVPDEEYT